MRALSNVKRARVELGLSQSELAQELGVVERTIRSYENGGSIPSPILIKLARLTNHSTDYLLGIKEENE